MSTCPIYLTRDRRFPERLCFDVSFDLALSGAVWQNDDKTWSHSDDVSANLPTRDEAVADLWIWHKMSHGGGR